MLSINLENSLSYGIFYQFWKKVRVCYTLSVSRREGGAGPRTRPLDLPLSIILATHNYSVSCQTLKELRALCAIEDSIARCIIPDIINTTGLINDICMN